MNLVRAALIGVALGLLAIGLPGSEDTPARQRSNRVCLVTPPSQLTALAGAAVAPMPIPVNEAPQPVSEASHPANRIKVDEEPAALAQLPEIGQQPEFEEEPEQEVVEDDVWLVALNRAISLEPASIKKASSTRQARLEADLEQAEVKLTGVLNKRRGSERSRVRLERADMR